MKALFIAVVLAVSTQFAHGEIINGDYEIDVTAFGGVDNSGTFIVPAGGSLLIAPGATANFDFTTGDLSTLTLSVNTGGPLGVGSAILWEFTGLTIDNIAPVNPEVIRSLVFNSAASTPGVSVDNQAFTDDSITITTADFAASTFEFSFLVSTIPEPTHFAVFALAAIGFFVLRRRSPVSA